MNRTTGFLAQNCLACGNHELVEILNLGEQTPVNNLTLQKLELDTFELALVVCVECGHGQQKKLLPPSLLFSDYLYASSTSNSLAQYSKVFAELISRTFKKSPKVFEIACNDGILLREMHALGLNAIGMDPASNLIERAKLEGLNALIGYWPENQGDLGSEKFQVVIGQNVLAHTPDPYSFLQAASEILANDGIAIFQTSQCDMVSRNEFDTIYHEHFSFFCEDSARALGNRTGFPNLITTYSPIHGTSSIYIFSKSTEGTNTARALAQLFEDRFPNAALKELHSTRRVRTVSDWLEFSTNSKTILKDLKSQLNIARKSGQKIVCVGASAKGITAIKASDATPDYFIDEAIDKIGKWIPGLNLQISDFSKFQFSEKDYYVLTAWNFASEIADKMIRLGANPSSRVLMYFPKVQEFELQDLL